MYGSTKLYLRVRFNVLPNTLWVISDTTNSVNALKEDKIIMIRLQSHQVHHPPCYNNNTTHIQYEKLNIKYTNIYIIESRHSEMGPVRQNQMQRTAHCRCI